MIIYPAIDLIGSQVVRLFKGDFEQKTTYASDPLEVAKSFQDAGAKFLHMVDLDGAKASKPVQTDIFEQIAKNTNLELQVGGGIRSLDDVGTLLRIGVKRVVIGSLAVKDPVLTKKIFQEYGGDSITLGLDVQMGEGGSALVATHGWQQVSDVPASSLLNEYLEVGLEQVLCTDISRDGTLTEPNFQLYADLQDHFPTVRFLASGGVTTVEQIKELKANQVGGAIIGRALYEGKIDLKEALEC